VAQGRALGLARGGEGAHLGVVRAALGLGDQARQRLAQQCGLRVAEHPRRRLVDGDDGLPAIDQHDGITRGTGHRTQRQAEKIHNRQGVRRRGHGRLFPD